MQPWGLRLLSLARIVGTAHVSEISAILSREPEWPSYSEGRLFTAHWMKGREDKAYKGRGAGVSFLNYSAGIG